MSTSAGARLVYRPTVSRISVAGFAVFALWWAIDDLVTGDGERMAVTGPILLAIGIVLWGLFWRPAVIVDDDGVDLLNVVRDVRIPWAVLELVETRYALTLHVDENRFRSWAAGAPGRPLPGRASVGMPTGKAAAREHDATGEAEAVRASRSLRGDSGAAAFMVEQRWEQRRTVPAAGTERVTVRWVWHWPLAAAIALAAAAVGAALS